MADDRCPHCGSPNSEDASLCSNCGLQARDEDREDQRGDEALQTTIGCTQDLPVAHPGSSIGGYRVIRKLGHGGMGVVWEAEQQMPRRPVALKVIRGGQLGDEHHVKLFEREVQTLARLKHPGIAAIHEAGCTADGEHFFAMELVRGESLADYLAHRRGESDHPFDTSEVLSLFLQVADAVSYAHQRAVIHRDLKPSNILVSCERFSRESSGSGPVPPRIKIVDFGLARITEADVAATTALSEAGTVRGTLQYMSPEQTRGNPDEIDLRSDVYSMGVILYEMLTGAPPYQLPATGVVEAIRIIRDDRPGQPRRAWAENRSTLNSTTRTLDRDLETIVLKALEKEPSRRYQSVSDMAGDIERHLAGHPIMARPPSAGYQLRKLVARHRTGAGFLVALLLLLSGFLVVTALQSGRIARQRDRAELEAQRVRLEAEALQAAVFDDLEGYVSSSRQAIQLHREATRDDDHDWALILVNTHSVVNLLLDLAESGPPSEASVEYVKELVGETLRLCDRSENGRAPALLEAVDQTIHLLEDGFPDTAEQLYRESTFVFTRVLPRGDRWLFEAVDDLSRLIVARASAELRDARPAEAESLFREAQQVWHEAGLGGYSQAAEVQGKLGECIAAQLRFAEAEPLLLESFQSLNSREALLRLVRLYEQWGKPDKASHHRSSLIVESVRDLGPVRAWGGILGRGGGYSASLSDRSFWVFGDTFFVGGFRSSTWSWTGGLDARNGIELQQSMDDRGLPVELLPFTPEEQQFNKAEAPRRWAVRPGSVVADPSRSRLLVAYSKTLVEPGGGLENDHNVGSSFALWEPLGSGLVRPVPRPNTDHPTLLFQGDEPRLETGAVVVGDYLYAYAPRRRAFQWPSIVGRVMLDDPLDRNAWEFYAGSGSWTTDSVHAISVIDAAPGFTVHWNEFLGVFVALYNTLSNRITLRTAPRPEGPWSPPREILELLAPEERGALPGFVLAHPEFSRQQGRIEYLSYDRNLGWLRGEARIVELEFRRPG